MDFLLFATTFLDLCLSALRRLSARGGRSRSPGDAAAVRAAGLRRASGEAGMTTAEYAIGTIAACTFAALLIAIVRSPEIRAALLSIITSALDLGR